MEKLITNHCHFYLALHEYKISVEKTSQNTSSYFSDIWKVIVAHVLSLRKTIFSCFLECDGKQHIICQGVGWGDQSKRYRNLVTSDITTDASIVICPSVFHWSIIQVKDIFKTRIKARSNPSLDTEMPGSCYGLWKVVASKELIYICFLFLNMQLDI